MRQVRTLLIFCLLFLMVSVTYSVRAEDESPKGTSFDYCNQIPTNQRPACLSCMGTRTVTDSEIRYANEGKKIFTAVGCLSVSGEELAADLIRLLLGLAGAATLLSLLGASFIFTASRGEAAKIKEAKELITAAVSGVLFLIFSVIILQFIGVTILKIPGLN